MFLRFSYSLEGVRDDGDDQNNSDGESINLSSEHDAEDKNEEEDIEEEDVEEEEHFDSESEDKADYKEDVENSKKEKEEIGQNKLRNPAEAEVEENEDCSDQSSNEESSDNEDCAMDDLTDLMPSFDITSANSTKPMKEESRKSEKDLESEEKQEMSTSKNTTESKCEVELDLPYVIKGKIFLLSIIITVVTLIA